MTCGDEWCDRPARYEVNDQMWCGIHARMHKRRNTQDVERKQRREVRLAAERRADVLIGRFADLGFTKIDYSTTALGDAKLALSEVQAEAILMILE